MLKTEDFKSVGSCIILKNDGVLLQYSRGRWVTLDDQSAELFMSTYAIGNPLCGIYKATNGLDFELDNKGFVVDKQIRNRVL